MKYRVLPKEELLKLEKEFIDFLVINGITADDWVKIQKEDLSQADLIIEQFSDVVWEGSLRKAEYLTKVEAEKSYYFKCNKATIELILVNSLSGRTTLKQASKKYRKAREEELFEMLDQGCVLDDGASYNKLVTEL